MDLRKEKERRFHDELRIHSYAQRWSPELEKTIRENPLWSNMKYYSIERSSRQAVLNWFSKECRNKYVLDYCCGNGEDAFYIAEHGAGGVLGIDISEVSIKNCEQGRRNRGLKNLAFRIMDAESLELEDNSFDIVTEYGSLHHLNLKKAYSEIARVLKPDGKAISVEALGHNPIIRYYRKKTPQLRTQWEIGHILHKKDIETASTYFKEVEVLGFFHLATIAAVAFRNLPVFGVILSFLETVDSLILKLPFLRWQAWQLVLVLSEPKK